MLPSFPSTGSIPPAEFYNRQGLSSWLNMNSSYKQYFINYPRYFPYLYSDSTIQNYILFNSHPSSLTSSFYANYVIDNVPLAPFVTTLSQQQSLAYNKQIAQFQTVYAYNSNAYVTSLDTGIPPVYFHFQSYKDYMDYKASVGLINKMYPFDAMAHGTNQYGSTLGWIVPFPL